MVRLMNVIDDIWVDILKTRFSLIQNYTGLKKSDNASLEAMFNYYEEATRVLGQGESKIIAAAIPTGAEDFTENGMYIGLR